MLPVLPKEEQFLVLHLDNYEKNFNINTRAPFLLMQESNKNNEKR